MMKKSHLTILGLWLSTFMITGSAEAQQQCSLTKKQTEQCQTVSKQLKERASVKKSRLVRNYQTECDCIIYQNSLSRIAKSLLNSTVSALARYTKSSKETNQYTKMAELDSFKTYLQQQNKNTTSCMCPIKKIYDLKIQKTASQCHEQGITNKNGDLCQFAIKTYIELYARQLKNHKEQYIYKDNKQALAQFEKLKKQMTKHCQLFQSNFKSKLGRTEMKCNDVQEMTKEVENQRRRRQDIEQDVQQTFSPSSEKSDPISPKEFIRQLESISDKKSKKIFAEMPENQQNEICQMLKIGYPSSPIYAEFYGMNCDR